MSTKRNLKVGPGFPHALEEVSAIMLEIIRKKVSRDKTLGYSHKESDEQSSDLLLMDRTNLNNSPDTGERYSWRPKGHSVVVSIHYDFVDKLLLEVMKGFGSIPRRGAEVGGLLLGTSETRDGELHVTLQDFHPVRCEHTGGPSFLLSEKDTAEFAAAVEQWLPSAERETMSVVGHYRSHTRDGLGMTDEDIDLMDDLLPGDGNIFLLVKPFATRVSTAGIFFRESGEFLRTDASYQEFPFRRKDMGGGNSGTEKLAAAARFGQSRPMDNPIPFPAARPPAQTEKPFERLQERERNEAPPPERVESFSYSDPPPQPDLAGDDFQPVRKRKDSKIRTGWVWIPASVIFLTFGWILGFQSALSMRPNGPAALGPEIFNLSLKVIKRGDELNLTWDRLAPAIRTAGRGVLHIKDGDNNQSLPFDVTDLQVGSLVYRKPSPAVTFKLEVYPKDHVMVSESVDYKAAP